ncbi:sex peptide receptor-like [Trichoplusia ni]|uniref:Sex peptide receptor-like n=1 Tax=Trichoplusia ni TaxID=7111 RepID=A0A7E5WWE4_TRINI|nr:sex peptide receptor-like [Trichoplusia ni]
MSNFEGDGVAYCVPNGQMFQRAYVKIHGYIALIICLLGCAANSVNIAVLSRKEMISSTNSILTGLAVADLLVMIDYIPFALHIYTNICAQLNKDTYAWAVFVYFHSIFSQTFHTISIWLTITLAVWRFIAIKFPQKNRTLCNKKNTNIAIAVAYAVCPILCLPIYFAMKIQEITPSSRNGHENGTLNDTDVRNTSTSSEPVYAIVMTDNNDLLTAIFWIYSVFIKLIPCVVLSILSVLLILKMKSSDRRRQKLLKKSAITTNEGEKARLNDDGGKRGGGGRTDRTTRMLVALLGLFLATELPQALFGLLTAIAPHLFQVCYYAFGEVMDLMALVGSAVNFVLYCSMSRQFRSTFTRLAQKALPIGRGRGEPITSLKA